MSATLSELRHVLDDVELEGVPRASASAPIFVSRWRELPALRARLEPWWAEHLDVLAAHAQRAADLIDGDSLLHWDIRSDNVMLGDRRTVLVDWGQVRVGRAGPAR